MPIGALLQSMLVVCDLASSQFKVALNSWEKSASGMNSLPLRGCVPQQLPVPCSLNRPAAMRRSPSTDRSTGSVACRDAPSVCSCTFWELGIADRCEALPCHSTSRSYQTPCHDSRLCKTVCSIDGLQSCTAVLPCLHLKRQFCMQHQSSRMLSA